MEGWVSKVDYGDRGRVAHNFPNQTNEKRSTNHANKLVNQQKQEIYQWQKQAFVR